MKFDHPLSASDRALVVTLLVEASDESITVGQCSLFPDAQLNLIWGTDAYGQDAVAARSLGIGSAHKALAWVDLHHSGVPHPAE